MPLPIVFLYAGLSLSLKIIFQVVSINESAPIQSVTPECALALV